jgi:hypothetical protein
MNDTKLKRIRQLVEDPEAQEFLEHVRSQLMPDGRFEFGRSHWTDVFAMASACLAVEEAYGGIWERLFP